MTKKKQSIRVDLTREYKKGDKVIYCNHGRFVPDEESHITLVAKDGKLKIKARPV